MRESDMSLKVNKLSDNVRNENASWNVNKLADNRYINGNFRRNVVENKGAIITTYRRLVARGDASVA